MLSQLKVIKGWANFLKYIFAAVNALNFLDCLRNSLVICSLGLAYGQPLVYSSRGANAQPLSLSCPNCVRVAFPVQGSMSATLLSILLIYSMGELQAMLFIKRLN